VDQACDYKTGTCVDYATTSNTILDSWKNATTNPDKITCFGDEDMENCETGYVCNPRGTTKGGKITDPTKALATNICLHPDALAENGGYVCFTYPDTVAVVNRTLDVSTDEILCNATHSYCVNGACSDVEPTLTNTTGATNTAGTTGTDTGSNAVKASVWLGFVVAAAFW